LKFQRTNPKFQKNIFSYLKLEFGILNIGISIRIFDGIN
jgi:hypothetical protein